MGNSCGEGVASAGDQAEVKPKRKRTAVRPKVAKKPTQKLGRNPSRKAARSTVIPEINVENIDSEQGSGDPQKLIDIKEVIRSARPEIIRRLVDEAKQGSLQHMKLFLELFPEVVGDVDENEKQTLAELLWAELNVEAEHLSATIA